MSPVVLIASVLGGLALGVLAGFRIGKGLADSRPEYWAVNVLAVVGCALLNFAGNIFGMLWLAYGALGLMGGLLTGMKYGYFGSGRAWTEPDAGEDSDTTDAAAQPASREVAAEVDTEGE